MENELQTCFEQKGYTCHIDHSFISTHVLIAKEKTEEVLDFYCRFYSQYNKLIITTENVEKMGGKLLRYVLRFFEEKTDKPIVLFIQNQNDEIEQQCVEKWVEKKGYLRQSLDEDLFMKNLCEYDGNITNQECFIKKEGIDKLNHMLTWLSSVEDSMETYEKKELCFTQEKRLSYNYSIHFNGFNGRMIFILQNDQYSLLLYDTEPKLLKEWVFSTQEETNRKIDECFTFIKTKQRIKNVLVAPTHFYDLWARNFHVLHDRKKRIYEALFQQMTPLEVEEFAAGCVKNSIKKQPYTNECYSYEFQEKMIIINMQTCEVKVKKVLQIKQESMEERLKDIQ